MDKNALKIVIAVVVLLIAGIVVAMQLGVFSGGGNAATTGEDWSDYTPEDLEDLQDEAPPGERVLPPPPRKPR